MFLCNFGMKFAINIVEVIIMKQALSFQQTFKHTLKLNPKIIHSLDFLKLSHENIQEMINEMVQTNPFIDLDTHYNHYDLNYIENICDKVTLQDELLKQLYAYPYPCDKDVIHYLILSLNDHGFLSYNEDVYIKELNINAEVFYKNLNILQSFEPIGVGAFDAFDSICIQLKHAGKINSYLQMKKYKNIILNQDYKKLKQEAHLTTHEINNLYEDIKACQPFPCDYLSHKENDYITPDMEIIVENNEITIKPMNDSVINLNNDLYETVKNNPQMKEYFDNALFFIDNLNNRNKTMLLIANELVKIQQGYFKYCDELLPCTLADLSSRCHFHESTISRTLNQKYYLFNGEVFPLKHLLVSKTLSGDSSDSIKKAIISIIANENKSKPFSDEQIVIQLESLDLYCSRRTIAKYRTQLNIPSSSKRKIKM